MKKIILKKKKYASGIFPRISTKTSRTAIPVVWRIPSLVLILLTLVFTLLGTGFPLGRTTAPVSAAADPIIAAAGDIACDPANTVFNNGKGDSSSCRQLYTSRLLVNAGLAAVLDLGDNQYYCGGYQAFLNSYDLSWGQVKSITHPAVGNHEYITDGGTGTTGCDITNEGAAGYYQYFGSAAGNPGQGYYSFDIGAWHLIALNTSCGDAGGCTSGSPQYKWLKADLAAHAGQCTLAYWHVPLFSSGGRAATQSLPFWQLLYASHADVVLNGHDHIYERFAPQDPSGQADTVNGIREFIVGTGGANHTSLAIVAANSEVSNTNTFGVLKLTLHSNSYDWEFEPESGKNFTDTGSQACHQGLEPSATPSSTKSLTATSSPTNTPTFTLTTTNTPTFTLTTTNTPTMTASRTNSPTFTSTRTNTPTRTSTMTRSPTATLPIGNPPPPFPDKLYFPLIWR
jgi:acid phosphatase type 7